MVKCRMKELKIKLLVCIKKDNGGFYAFCPALRGAYADGETIEEALENYKDVATAHILSMLKHNEPLPVGQFLSVKERIIIPRRCSYKEITLTLPLAA